MAAGLASELSQPRADRSYVLTTTFRTIRRKRSASIKSDLVSHSHTVITLHPGHEAPSRRGCFWHRNLNCDRGENRCGGIMEKPRLLDQPEVGEVTASKTQIISPTAAVRAGVAPGTISTSRRHFHRAQRVCECSISGGCACDLQRPPKRG